jgi:hypothetical protein
MLIADPLDEVRQLGAKFLVNGPDGLPQIDGSPLHVSGIPGDREHSEMLVEMRLPILVGGMGIRHADQASRPPLPVTLTRTDEDRAGLQEFQSRFTHGLEQTETEIVVHL